MAGQLAFTDATPTALTRGCFVRRTDTPLGLKQSFAAESDRVETRYRPRPEHAGFRQTVHGGLTSTVLDEAMVWACGAATGRLAYCAELTVRFRQPLQPESEYVVTARLVENRKSRIYVARGEVRAPAGNVMAVGEGKYVPVDDGNLTDLWEDSEQDPRPVLTELARPAQGFEFTAMPRRSRVVPSLSERSANARLYSAMALISS